MKLRSAASGWVRAGLFAVLSLVAFLAFHKVMARSAHAFAAFAYTFVGLAALPIIDDVRRRKRRGLSLPEFETAPRDATYERLLSPAALAWPAALVLWVLIPASAVAAAANLAVGQWVHDVAGSMGGVAAVITGALAGLAAWMGLRTVAIWRLGDSIGRWPLWVEAPPTSLSFHALVNEWRRPPVYYIEPPARHLRSVS